MTFIKRKARLVLALGVSMMLIAGMAACEVENGNGLDPGAPGDAPGAPTGP